MPWHQITYTHTEYFMGQTKFSLIHYTSEHNETKEPLTMLFTWLLRNLIAGNPNAYKNSPGLCNLNQQELCPFTNILSPG